MENVLNHSGRALQRMQLAYEQHLSSSANPIVLHELFRDNEFNLTAYCTSFRPHHHATTLIRSVEAFGKSYGIWSQSAKHYITCAIYLFPFAHIYRMQPVLKNCAIDFHLNDTIGRERYPKLSTDEKNQADIMIQRMSSVEGTSNLPENALPIEHANREMLFEIQMTSPKAWFDNFLHLYMYHNLTANTNCNSAHLGRIPTIKEYIDHRCHVSGMPHTISLIEYCAGQFLDWRWLEASGLASPLTRLQRVVAEVGGLMNDLFSFEKEVIDYHSDSNLITVIADNEPQLSFEGVILAATNIVKDLLLEFVSLTEEIRNKSYTQLPQHSSFVDVLESHLSGLENCIQACWVWQITTQRYKRNRSIWAETQLQDQPF